MDDELRGIAANRYQQQALKTESTPCFVNIEGKSPEENLRLSRLLHGLIGVCTEVGEGQDALKKAIIYGKELDEKNLIEELGDKLWYIALALDALGATMSEAMLMNLHKLAVRYGGKFSKEAALNRDLEAERQVFEENSEE